MLHCEGLTKTKKTYLEEGCCSASPSCRFSFRNIKKISRGRSWNNTMF